MLAEPEATKPLLQRFMEVPTLLTSSLCTVAMADRQHSHSNSFQTANSSVMQEPPTNTGFYIPNLEFLPFCRLTSTMCSILKQHWAVQQGLASPVFHFSSQHCGCPSRSLVSALLGAADAAETLAPTPFGSPPCKSLNMSFPHSRWAPLAQSPWALNCLSNSTNPPEFHQPTAPHLVPWKPRIPCSTKTQRVSSSFTDTCNTRHMLRRSVPDTKTHLRKSSNILQGSRISGTSVAGQEGAPLLLLWYCFFFIFN